MAENKGFDWFEPDYSWDTDADWATVRHDKKLTAMLRVQVLQILAKENLVPNSSRRTSDQALVDGALRFALRTLLETPTLETVRQIFPLKR